MSELWIEEATVQHIVIPSRYDFETTKSAIEDSMPVLDMAPIKQSIDQQEHTSAMAALSELPPLVIFDIRPRNVKPILSQYNHTSRAAQYSIGNPLTAIRMTSISVMAGLYPPFRVLLYEEVTSERRAVIRYIRPSSLVAHLHEEELGSIARELDQEFENVLVATAGWSRLGEWSDQLRHIDGIAMSQSSVMTLAPQTAMLLAILLLVICWRLLVAAASSPLSHIPRVGRQSGIFDFGRHAAKKAFAKDAKAILYQGYLKYRRGLYRVQTLNVERVIVTPAYIEELTRKIPDGLLDVADGLKERLLSSYTDLDVVFNSSLHVDVCKSQLTHNLRTDHPHTMPQRAFADKDPDALMHPLREEVAHWLPIRLAAGDTAYETIVRIIAATTSVMLSGQEASRNEAWLETAAQYSMDVVRIAMQLRPWPSSVRRLVALLLIDFRPLKKHLAVTKTVFKPKLQERLIRSQEVADGDKPVDMIQWLAESAQGRDRDADQLAQNVLFMALAGVHTSTATVVHVLFDLCAYPEYVQPLREEITAVVDEHGWSLSTITRLKKLDSFIKESQRLNQAVLMTFNRRVTKQFRLEDGTMLPKGTYLAMPSDAVARDPDVYPDPDTFDGFRFFEKRATGSKAMHKHQFASADPESLAFGQGRHACPGRFFAAAQIKTTIIQILQEYDISFPSGQRDRPKNIHKGGLVRPDPKQMIIFTPRTPAC